MQCPLCRQRPVRRACPALGREICAVCCGSKRLVEIACPPTCRYLAAAEAHPASVVRKQHERDVAIVESLVEGLSRPQMELAWGVMEVIARFGADPLLRLRDEDVAEMATALASTLRTAARGVIYEHRPGSLAAQRLGAEVKAFLERPDAPAGVPAVPVLERLAETCRHAGSLTGEAAPERCLAALGRAVRAAATAARMHEAASAIEPPRPTLVLP